MPKINETPHSLLAKAWGYNLTRSACEGTLCQVPKTGRSNVDVLHGVGSVTMILVSIELPVPRSRSPQDSSWQQKLGMCGVMKHEGAESLLYPPWGE